VRALCKQMLFDIPRLMSPVILLIQHKSTVRHLLEISTSQVFISVGIRFKN
jgi:hypothetical protein